jgi:deazaflavin-dependent oxidoreductase (nitroreductase family)
MAAGASGYDICVSNSYRDFNRTLISDLRAHGGKASSGPFLGADVLILTTVGARTGERRESPLAFSRDGENLVIVASRGGGPKNPSWYHNLVVNPVVTIEALGEKFEARARVVENPDDYERLYAEHARRMPGFNEYRRMTSRRIPVIALERIPSERVA